MNDQCGISISLKTESVIVACNPRRTAELTDLCSELQMTAFALALTLIASSEGLGVAHRFAIS